MSSNIGEVYVTSNSITIEDGWVLTHKEFKGVLNRLKSAFTSKVFDMRSMYSLECEWVCHKVLYKLGILRSHTKDLDLEADCKIKALYYIFGTLLYIFA